MSAPTSVPRTISSNNERKPKLRASCDSCAASKVKCSKEHPKCARCSANDSPCIYGVSRKHGKPGRTRKRNPDGTPFVKVSKQRSSPAGSEFSKFKVHPESTLQHLQDMETPSSWPWSPTPSLPTTPELDFEMTPDPPYINLDASDLTFMDEPLLQLEIEPIQTIEPNLVFRDPFPKTQPAQMDLLDLQALKDYIGGDAVNPMDYNLTNATNMDLLQSRSAVSSPQSPKSQRLHSYNAMDSIIMPTAHCCYTLAYSTLESLKAIGVNTIPGCPGIDQKSLNSTLAVTRVAMQGVLQLLRCPCSSDPHLAMLYSSITSKILTWYRIAAGVQINVPSSQSHASSQPSSGLSSPSTAPSAEDEMNLDAHLQSLRFNIFEFEELEQEKEKVRRQVVLGEMRECGQFVEALANWRGDGVACEQAEFLYDVLGAWLKSELYKTVKEVEVMDAP